MRRNTLLAACALWCVMAAGAARAEDAKSPAAADPKLDALLKDIDQRAAMTADLAGRFTQEKHTALLRKPLVSSGRIRMKGSVVRWDTEQPEPGVLHSDGREIRLYYPKQSVVEVYPIDRRLSDLAASPLPRLDALRQYFRIEALPADRAPKDERGDANRLSLRLTPANDYLAQHVEEVRVTLDVAAAYVVRVEMDDADGDRTVIRFGDVKTNTGLKDLELNLVLPPGTKVSRPLEGGKGGGGK
jgi:outer membrane lipoprotein-sorting protein